jgi:hypothetical protein
MAGPAELAPAWLGPAIFGHLAARNVRRVGRLLSSPVFSISEKTTVHTIKAGLNFRFM